jgi:hypothetical protein
MLSHHPSARAVCVPKCDPNRFKRLVEITDRNKCFQTLGDAGSEDAICVRCDVRSTVSAGPTLRAGSEDSRTPTPGRLTTQSFRDKLSRDFSRPVFLAIAGGDCNTPFGTPAPAASATALAIWPGGVLVWVDSGGKIWISPPPELGKHCGRANGRQGRRVVRSKLGMLELPSRFA